VPVVVTELTLVSMPCYLHLIILIVYNNVIFALHIYEYLQYMLTFAGQLHYIIDWCLGLQKELTSCYWQESVRSGVPEPYIVPITT
jgi:hypothetical protein